ncbi:glucose-6-phosphate 1-epimerase [Dentipellis sp. KUC8613]|nr:glucose-6-phosphate 1-epimerase [Dentipellis sp. KUC8613]
MPYEQTTDRVILKHPQGASAEILLYGATVLSWKSPDATNNTPTERLFVSSKAALDGTKPVRGGIPVVFPCFGPPSHPEHLKLAQHGFARSEVWAFDSVVMDNDAGVSVRFTLGPTPKITALYDRPFQLAYVVTLAAHELSTNLHVTNPAPSGLLTFQALLHTYLRAPSSEVRISALQGKKYVDKTAGGAVKEETREFVDVKATTDAVYEDAPGQVEVRWGAEGHGVLVKMREFTTLTVWNPQAEGAKIGDMEDGGWERYVCVEPGIARGFKDLEPGKTWIGQQVLSLL